MDLNLQKQLELEAEAELELEQEQAAAAGGSPFLPAPQDNVERAARVTTGGLLNILNGATLNFGDEIVSGANAGIDYLANQYGNIVNNEDNNTNISELYNNRYGQSKQLRGEFNTESPIGGVVTEVGGGFLNPVNFLSKANNVGRLEQIGRAALTGATQGGLYGLGEDENRLENGLGGALWGGALGGTLESLIGSPVWKDVGGRLQRGAMGIRQADIKAAAAGLPRGAENPAITAFDNLIEEGVFKGSKAPANVRERLVDRAASLNTKLDDVLTIGDAAVPAGLPNFPSSEKYLSKLKGKDYTDASKIFNEEVSELIGTLDNGGTVKDWQAAKRSVQGNTKYGTDTAALRNDVRQQIASDLRQHIEDSVDKFAPSVAGEVKKTNQQLSDGLRVDSVLKRGQEADAARDPVDWIKNQFRTSGGFGVPMLLAAGAGGTEAARGGSVEDAVKAGLLGATLGTRGGKFAMGTAIRGANKLVPAITGATTTPFFVKQLARNNKDEAGLEKTAIPLDYFKAGSDGVAAYRNTGQSIDDIYKEATSNFREYAAPTGKVDPSKVRKWVANNSEALNNLPELKQQLTNPATAQRLIDRHFRGSEPLAPEQINSAALKEYVAVEPIQLASQIFSYKNPEDAARKTIAYLKGDKEAVAGLRQATVQFFNEQPDSKVYAKNRQMLERSGVFTASQIKVADRLFGYDGASDPETENSTLKAILQMRSNDFLQTAPYGKYTEMIEPVIRSIPPEQFRAKIERALADPLLARDLMNKANSKNVVSGLERLFSQEINAAAAGEQPATPPPAPTPQKTLVPKQEQVLSKSSFPNPQDLLRPPTTGTPKKISLDVNSIIAQQDPETRARISVESAGDPYAVSRKGAQGLSQLMPETAQDIAKALGETYIPLRPGMPPEQQRASIEQNIRFGSHYMNVMLPKIDKAFENETLARAAYNAGPRRVQEAIALAGSSRDVNKVLANLPKGVQKETIPYVQRIAQRYGNV